jgi:multidrug efflux pump
LLPDDPTKKEVPDGVVVSIGKDFTEPVPNSITEVKETILIAFALVVLIIFIFLRDWRSTLIPVLAIPVSIIAPFSSCIFLASLLMCLRCLQLYWPIGLVVDDAIVVLENVYEKVEKGVRPMEAAIAGSAEIYFRSSGRRLQSVSNSRKYYLRQFRVGGVNAASKLEYWF